MTSYRGNRPLLAAAMFPYPGQATNGQNYIPVPGGVAPGLNIVMVGGAWLAPGDYDDSDGLGIALSRAMSSGTQFLVVAFSKNTSYVPVQGQLAGFRNLLINADGRVNQRVYVSGAATGGANQYTVDRWRVVVSGQNLAFAATANGYTMTAPAGGVEQVIEGNNILGGTYCLDWQGTATATVNGVAVNKKGTFTLPANTNATVRFTGGTFYLPQLEYGSVATLFEQRPLTIETMLAWRYYQRITGLTTNVARWCLAQAYATTICEGVVPFQPGLRGTPTMNYSAASDFAANDAGGTRITGTAVLLNPNGPYSFLLRVTVASGLVAGNASEIISTNTNGWVDASAEL